MHATITPQQLHERFLAGEPLELIDVRTPAEFADHHVSFARNVPLDQLDPAQFASRPTVPLYVICLSGGRARQACAKLASTADASLVLVEGGTQAWCQAGLPVVRGKKSISLERQVRIAAGLLVLTGSVLTALVSPYWLMVPAFVGAGLTFAGITDTCAMGMLLARMPWNQTGASASVSCQRS